MDTLKIINIFKSIDGEAYHAGRPTIFLRTYGCNLRCAYPCDTPESWNPAVYSKLYDRPLLEMQPEEAFALIAKLAGEHIRHVTITGGEPLLPENVPWMKILSNMLLGAGYSIDFETNGAVPLAEMAAWRASLVDGASLVHFIMDWKCSSSKMLGKMLPANLNVLRSWDVVKCVVADDDFEDVINVRARLDPCIPIYISPSFGKVTMSHIPDFVLRHSQDNYCCQLQQHKYFWSPTEKDV